MKTYNKLVRDNIPLIIKSSGKECETRILNRDEYLVELKKKLIEESTELYEANSVEEKIEELADIYEVLETILKEEKIDLKEVNKIRIHKNMDKGAFEKKVYLKNVK